MRTILTFLSILIGIVVSTLVLDGLTEASRPVPAEFHHLPLMTPMICILLPEPDGMVLDCYLPLNETPPHQEDGNFQRWPSPPAQMKPFKSA